MTETGRQEKLQGQIEQQARTITALNFKISRLTRERDYLLHEIERLGKRKPTPEEIAEAIFDG